MGRMLGLLLLLAGVSGILAQTDMKDQVFLFPKRSSHSHVRLLPAKNDPIDHLTVCLRSYTQLTRSHALFSLATENKDDAFLLFSYPHPTNMLSVSVGNHNLDYNLTARDTAEWRSTCVSWDSSTGVVQLWINGKPYPRKVLHKGHKINAKPIIVIGQEQDSYGGNFAADQSFMGEITDVHMWDKVLTQQNIADVLYKNIGGNVINWRSLKYEVEGHVIIQPYLCEIFYSSTCYPT
ncbi:C-reactive protein-like [Ascaphus truei]|uniref:C-reactive protein-like n=1 Tax=Ascaphus truei TaxID=8439 RepID=UPI003F599E5D